MIRKLRELGILEDENPEFEQALQKLEARSQKDSELKHWLDKTTAKVDEEWVESGIPNFGPEDLVTASIRCMETSSEQKYRALRHWLLEEHGRAGIQAVEPEEKTATEEGWVETAQGQWTLAHNIKTP